MKKIINQPDNYIKEMLEGIYIAHKDDLACVDGDLQVLVSKHKKEGKVVYYSLDDEHVKQIFNQGLIHISE